ncbi:MAG: RND transporter [Gammaproteobacteria bacterium]|nr:RND transporter [Gammaproteobacteria bacterium]
MNIPGVTGPLSWVQRIPWPLLILGSLTLGLAPFFPEPHLLEKLRMLVQGELVRPIDIFDLCLHGAFPLLLLLRVALHLGGGQRAGAPSGED